LFDSWSKLKLTTWFNNDRDQAFERFLSDCGSDLATKARCDEALAEMALYRIDSNETILLPESVEKGQPKNPLCLGD
jgi:hypothetical protein